MISSCCCSSRRRWNVNDSESGAGDVPVVIVRHSEKHTDNTRRRRSAQDVQTRANFVWNCLSARRRCGLGFSLSWQRRGFISVFAKIDAFSGGVR